MNQKALLQAALVFAGGKGFKMLPIFNDLREELRAFKLTLPATEQLPDFVV